MLDLLEQERFILFVGQHQLGELRAVLMRPFLRERSGVPTDEILKLLDLIDELGTGTASLPADIVVRDPDDQEILQAALSGGVDFLVTGDDDLLVLAQEPVVAPLRIVTPRQFVDLFDALR